MANTEWLNNLKAGDEVVVRTGYYGYELKHVDRVTPSQIIVVGKPRFRREDGYQIGSGRGSNLPCVLEQPTDALRDKVALAVLADRVRFVVWGRLPADAARRITAVLDEVAAAGAKKD